MEHLYGYFNQYQIDNYKEKLHKDLFWLLLYKDPKTRDQYKDVNFNKYFVFLMKKIDGLNTLLKEPIEIVDMMALLQAAKKEVDQEEFNYQDYRKLILDAHSLVNKIGG